MSDGNVEYRIDNLGPADNVACSPGKRDERQGVGCRDVDPALVALIPGLEIDRTGGNLFARFGKDTEMVPGVGGSYFCLNLVNAEFGFHPGFGCSFEESKNVLAMTVFGLFRLGYFGCSFFIRVLMDCVMDLLV